MLHLMNYEFLSNDCKEALSMRRKSREKYILKNHDIDGQICVLEKLYRDVKDKECLKYDNEKIISPEECKKAKKDECEKKNIALLWGKKYVRPPHLCNIFAKIDVQEKAIIKNRDLDRENIIIRKSNDRNAKYYKREDILIMIYMPKI